MYSIVLVYSMHVLGAMMFMLSLPCRQEGDDEGAQDPRR